VASNPFRDVTTVSFDADGTLWDFEKMMRASLGVTLEELRSHRHQASDLTVEAMIEIRDRVAAGWRGRIHDLERIRLMAFEKTVELAGGPDAALAGRLNTLYVKHRAEHIVLFDDVLPALEALRRKFTLGVISNGNTLPERIGLSAFFRFVVFASDHGAEKPDPGLFRVALEKAGCGPRALAHVGDSLVDDVAGAEKAGVFSVWLNRDGRPIDGTARPDLEIRSLAELAEALTR
jgi:putative hydrolase of the HAD superfamily